ncbi:ROK family protein [Nonomuraea sp. PA05]|uniref:ROK family protein n=1 Tax=Nonomuraea sp. PA05 TaxID=2604466 RepID=UPI0011D8D5FD|nr:ROK family protein [Nonomuraea sp. PA05]TYB62714.1 ROK family protein [Nonomuraea sp. PA05]
MILAVDVGGTKMAAGLVGRDGTVTDVRRAATPQGADPETLWRTLAGLLTPLAGRFDAVGMGCGGPLSWPDGEVSPLNIPGWRGFPLRARLAALFPSSPVRLHNDAVCLAVAEHWAGAGQGSDDMLGMVVSTGVGGGLILGGRLHHGRTGNAGHIGHVVVEPVGGPRCGCGGHGCLEAVARGPAVVAWALRQGWTPGAAGAAGGTAVRDAGAPGASVPGGGVPDAVARDAGAPAAAVRDAGAPAAAVRDVAESGAYREDRPVTARQLAVDARAGDPVATLAMHRAGRALGIALASATHLCDLDVITLGGGLSQAGEPLFGPLEEALREHARMGFARRVKVLPAALGQEAGLVGAAALHLAGDTYWPAQDD